MPDSTLPIEFHHDGGALRDAPMPVPMRQVLPHWFQSMPAVIGEHQRRPADVSHLTLRACAPLVEAMTAGYALLWPSTLKITLLGTRPDGAFDIRFEPAQPVILMSHPPTQAPGMPGAAFPILKLNNPWIVRTPRGTSCLIMPMLNRPEMPVIPFSAIVDTDRYFAAIHLPFMLIVERGGSVTIERGEPIAQLLPLRRGRWTAVRGEGDARALAETKATLASESGAYAKHVRVRGSFR